MSYMTLLTLFFARKATISEKEFLYDTFFLLCSYFRAHPTTLLLEILGGTNAMHGLSPHLKLWGDCLPSPPRFPPLSCPLKTTRTLCLSRALYNAICPHLRVEPWG